MLRRTDKGLGVSDGVAPPTVGQGTLPRTTGVTQGARLNRTVASSAGVHGGVGGCSQPMAWSHRMNRNHTLLSVATSWAVAVQPPNVPSHILGCARAYTHALGLRACDSRSPSSRVKPCILGRFGGPHQGNAWDCSPLLFFVPQTGFSATPREFLACAHTPPLVLGIEPGT